MAVLLLVSVILVGVPAGKATAASLCSTTDLASDWGWAALESWDCGHIPGAADNVTINHEISLSSDQAVNDLTINSGGGTLVFSADKTLTVNGTLDVNGGHLAMGKMGTLLLGGDAQTILTHGEWVDFWNLTKTGGSALTIDEAVADSDGELEGGLHILNALTLQGASQAQPLALQSANPGKAWQIWLNVGKAYTISDVSVRDAWVAVDGENPLVVVSGTNLGNNAGWLLGTSPTLTALALERSSDPSIIEFSEAIFEAVIDPADAAGWVEFRYGTEIVPDCGSVAVDESGSAECKTSNLPVSITQGEPDLAHIIEATFTSSVDPSKTVVSNQVTQKVVPSSFSLTTEVFEDSVVAASATSIVNVAARILPMANTGQVTFQRDGVDISSCTGVSVSKGRATCSVPMGPGLDTITASYKSVTSNPAIQLVNRASAVAAESLTPSGSSTHTDMVFRATVTSPSPTVGTITFRNYGMNILGCIDVPLVDNVATCTVSKPLSGAYIVTAVYSGDPANFIVSSTSSPALLQLVKTFYFLPMVFKR